MPSDERPLHCMWCARDRGSLNKACSHASKRLLHFVCAADGGLHVRGGCAGGDEIELVLLDLAAPAAVGVCVHRARWLCVAERTGAALWRLAFGILYHAAPVLPGYCSTVGKPMLRQQMSGGYGVPAGGCGRGDAGAWYSVAGGVVGGLGGRWDAATDGGKERSKVVEERD